MKDYFLGSIKSVEWERIGELRRIGGLEMKGREVGIMKGWKAGEVIGNHATTLSISTSKIRLKGEAKRKGAGAGNASLVTGGGVACE